MKNGHNGNNNINHRLKIVCGHLKKASQMQEDGTYCIDVLHQLQAIRSAIGKIEGKILENHLKGCVYDAFTKGRKDKAIKEVLTIFDKTR